MGTNSGWGSWDARSEDEAAPTVVQPGAALTSLTSRETPAESEWKVTSRKGNSARRKDGEKTPTAVPKNGIVQHGASKSPAALNEVPTNGVVQNGVVPNGVVHNGAVKV